MENIATKTDFAGRSVHSQSQTWCTPPKYVNAVRLMFDGKISLDPCSNDESIVDADVKYVLPEKDGLKESWNFPTIYVNPPYGADYERGTSIKDWIGRCCLANSAHSSEVLALIPVATNTVHWKKFIFGKACGICFLYDTRLKFLVNGSTDNKGAPMACAIVYWGKQFDKFCGIFSQFGATVDGRSIQCKDNNQQLSMDIFNTNK
jgi:hypothetical protein